MNIPDITLPAAATTDQVGAQIAGWIHWLVEFSSNAAAWPWIIGTIFATLALAKLVLISPWLRRGLQVTALAAVTLALTQLLPWLTQQAVEVQSLSSSPAAVGRWFAGNSTAAASYMSAPTVSTDVTAVPVRPGWYRPGQ